MVKAYRNMSHTETIDLFHLRQSRCINVRWAGCFSASGSLLQAQSLENQNLETLYSPQDYSPQTEPLHQTTPLWVQQPETEMRISDPRGLSMCTVLKTGE